MKVYSISQWAFAGICLLIVVLPVSRQWKLIARGEKARGTVLDYTIQARENRFGDKVVYYASNIRYRAGDTTLTVQGPESIEYEKGRIITVFYNPDEPAEHCLLTFSCLYLNNYTVLPLILLVVWGAFYLSFNNYRKRERSAAAGDAGDAPGTGPGWKSPRQRDPYFRRQSRPPRLRPGPPPPSPENGKKK